MGDVHLAKDTRLDRKVANKLLHIGRADRGVSRERFESEARSVSSLNHAHICVLYDVGEPDGRDYFVMELLEGETIAHRLARSPLPPDPILRHALDIAEAFDHEHRRGIVHRDLKPANVMLTKAGAKLLDFGLAKCNEDSNYKGWAADVGEENVANFQLVRGPCSRDTFNDRASSVRVFRMR
jgi:serine/threonine protein kinase